MLKRMDIPAHVNGAMRYSPRLVHVSPRISVDDGFFDWAQPVRMVDAPRRSNTTYSLPPTHTTR